MSGFRVGDTCKFLKNYPHPFPYMGKGGGSDTPFPMAHARRVGSMGDRIGAQCRGTAQIWGGWGGGQ